MFSSLRTLRGLAIESGAFRLSNLRMLVSQSVHRARNADAGYSDADHLRAAADWLGRAQDATPDGGVSGRYLLRSGWTSSYPETTGYIIPTFLALAEELKSDRLVDRAKRCVDFLESVRLPSGAFPGGEVDENRTTPSVFNSAQIINGLVAWHVASGEQRALDMAVGAADWLLAQLDDDGAWRKHAYLNTPVAYSSHASCWLAQLGAHTRETRYLDAARRHMEWVLTLYDPETGWFDRAGWNEADFRERRAETHTIAYTIWGVLYTAIACGHARGVAAARKAARAVARRLELSRILPGKLDSSWRPRATYQCLTGNAQMALIWMRLDELEPEVTLLNAALKAIDLVKAAQPMNNPNPGLRGGVAGSDPVWGDYVRFAVPNWPAKFYIDALLAKRSALARLQSRPAPDAKWELPAGVATTLPPVAAKKSSCIRVIMYTRTGAHKVPQMLNAWSSWGFKPAAVVIEETPALPARDRIRAKVREEGLGSLISKLTRAARRDGRAHTFPLHDATSRRAPQQRDVAVYCAELGIHVVHVATLDSSEGLEAVRALRPDLAIHAGAGIVRAPLLEIPRIGTLNAHMGVLPRYRGMNVAEWSRLLGGPVGCSVHFIDAGIDTGDIICVRLIDSHSARDIAELRGAVDREQIQLLGEVAKWIVECGSGPRAYAQRPAEGIQFFRMHAEMAAILETELRETSRGLPPK